jgi:hypothetical protein
MSSQTREQIDAVANEVMQKYPLLAPDQNNIDAIIKFLVANYAGYFSVSNMTTAIEALRPQLIWLKEPWQPIQRPPRKPPVEPERPLGPWDRQRLQSEQNAEEAKRQQAKQKLADAAAEKEREKQKDLYPAPVFRGGRVDHSKTEALRKAWRERHPEAKKAWQECHPETKKAWRERHPEAKK